MTVTPSSQSVEVTHTATFYAVVRGIGSDTFTYQWRRRRKIIKTTTGPVLVINDVSRRDSDSYRCTVKNRHGDIAHSKYVYLNVTSEFCATL